MDKTLRYALKAPSFLLTSMVLSRLGACQRLYTNCLQHKSTAAKDHMFNEIKFLNKKNNGNTQNELQKLTCHSTIFKLIQNNAATMNLKEAIEILTSLHNLCKYKRSYIKEINSKTEFLKLCDILYQNIHNLNLNQTIQLIKLFTFFDISSNSMIMQSLLQIIRRNINDLSLQQIIFLQFLLNKQKSTPLLEALKISLPIVFESHLKQKLQDENITSLASALLYAVFNKLSNKSVDVITDLIQEQFNEINVTAAKYIITAMFALNYRSPDLKNITQRTLYVLSNNLHEISYREMKIVFNSSCRHVKNKNNEFYNENFIETFITKLIQDNHGFVDAISTLEAINSISYSHIPLLDYAATKCFENSTIMKNCELPDIITLLEGFCLSDYKPLFWQAMQDSILSHKLWYKADYNDIVQVTLRLAILECFHQKPLQKVFQNADTSNENTLKNIVMLYHYTKGLCTSYPGPWPNKELLETNLRCGMQQNTFPLLPVLEKALGGSEYVLTKVLTKHAYIIDHVVVMRKGGYPVAINFDRQDNDITVNNYLEDMSFPSDSNVILILGMPSSAYPINSRKMKGHWTKLIKALENSLYPVVPISLTTLATMPERERIPYLMQELKLKCDDILVTSNL